MKYLLILLLFLSCSPDVIYVKYLKDGDSFVTIWGEECRMAEIDSPEHNQFYGQQSKQFLENHILYRPIKIKRLGKDKFGRTLCQVYINNIWINKLMVDNGMSWAYKPKTSLMINQQIAKQKKIGLWKYPNPQNPYIYRKLKQ